ncbi:MAG: hypothetical protein RLZZ292_2780 [Bacteroidota bacterium]|jgi:hypothetical protein
MKYRLLSLEELAGLEPDFIRFLSSQSIPGSDWEKIKIQQAQRRDELLSLFSDLVLERALNNIEYIEFRSPNDIKTFFYDKETAYLQGITIENEAIDFTKSIDIQAVLKNKKNKIHTYSLSKPYLKERNVELFTLLQQGALVSDGVLYKVLKNLS